MSRGHPPLVAVTRCRREGETGRKRLLPCCTREASSLRHGQRANRQAVTDDRS